MDVSKIQDHEVVVIVIPFPCQNHLNQLLHLSCRISSYNIPVYYATSATHLRQVKLRFNSQTLLQNPHLHFHEFPIPYFPSPPPNPNSSTTTTTFPAHRQPAFDASLHLRHPADVLLREISAVARRVVVIHDVLMAYVVQDIASLPNGESYTFNPISAFGTSFRELKDNKSFQSVEEMKEVASVEGCYTPEFLNYISLQSDFLSLSVGNIFNSCRSIEGTYIDLVAKEMNSKNRPMWVIGPLNHGTISDRSNSNGRHSCMDWLDKQDPDSVLYVAFGTTTSMEEEQIKELAIGLEQSKHKFIWVLRDADKGDIFAEDVKRVELPEGYEERVKEFGIVVRDWAPQVEILGHPSTGGFMTHCAWNSSLESITMGVPMATWPMNSDQPRTDVLVRNILKIGLVVKEWKRRQEIVNSSTISTVIKKLMGSEEGEAIRKRAREIGVAARQAVVEGGASRLELDSFVAHIGCSHI